MNSAPDLVRLSVDLRALAVVVGVVVLVMFVFPETVDALLHQGIISGPVLFGVTGILVCRSISDWLALACGAAIALMEFGIFKLMPHSVRFSGATVMLAPTVVLAVVVVFGGCLAGTDSLEARRVRFSALGLLTSTPYILYARSLGVLPVQF